MNRFGGGTESEELVKSGANTRLLSLEIESHIKDFIAKGGRIRIVDNGFCLAPNLTSFTNTEAAIKARKNGTRNSKKLSAVK